MEKPYVPEKWKNLRLEIDDELPENNCKIHKPRIIRTEIIIKNKKESILRNKKDVFKENHKKCEYEDCYKKHKLSIKCVIL